MAHWLDGRPSDSAPAPSAPGVFTTLRVAGGVPALLDAHLARLARDARALALPWPPPWDPARALAELLASGAPGAAALAVRIRWAPPHLALDARAVASEAESWTALVDPPGRTPLPEPRGIKTLARERYERLLAEARTRGADEALVTDAAGALVEGTRTNVFLVLDGELATPSLAAGGLPGVMRAALLTELERVPLVDARGRTWPARERTLGLADLERAEEILLTNAVRLVVGLAGLVGERARNALPGARGPVAAALWTRADELAR